MKKKSAASVYAKTIFSMTKGQEEREVRQAWINFLLFLQKTLNHSEVHQWLTMDNETSIQEKTTLLLEGFTSQIIDHQVLIHFFASLLKNRVHLLVDKIYDAFLSLVDEASNILRVTIEVANVLDQKTTHQIQDLVCRRFPNKEIHFQYIEDASLIAGFNILIKDKILRACLRDDLTQLFHRREA